MQTGPHRSRRTRCYEFRTLCGNRRPKKEVQLWFIINISRKTLWSTQGMIRFLQRPGPLKKYLLGGLLLIISATMVITLIPGGSLGSAFGFGGAAGQGVYAKVGDQEVTMQAV